MSACEQAITVIRLVRIGPRGVVADVTDATFVDDANERATYLIVPRDRGLARESGDRRRVSDIRVGDVVSWVGEPYAALWVADQAPEESGATR